METARLRQLNSLDDSFQDANDEECFRLRTVPGYTSMLELRLASGERWSFPYSMLLWAQWTLDCGFVVRFSTHTVIVRGRNLEPIFEGLVEHRLECIVAELPQHDLGDESRAFVNGIEVKLEE